MTEKLLPQTLILNEKKKKKKDLGFVPARLTVVVLPMKVSMKKILSSDGRKKYDYSTRSDINQPEQSQKRVKSSKGLGNLRPDFGLMCW